jgi:hypothetical protein
MGQFLNIIMNSDLIGLEEVHLRVLEVLLPDAGASLMTFSKFPQRLALYAIPKAGCDANLVICGFSYFSPVRSVRK